MLLELKYQKITKILNFTRQKVIYIKNLVNLFCSHCPGPVCNKEMNKKFENLFK